MRSEAFMSRKSARVKYHTNKHSWLKILETLKCSYELKWTYGLLVICSFLTSCTIQQNITITIMTNKKKTQTIQILTKYNRHKYNSIGEINDEPSQTVPGEETTIAEMLRMSARGELPPMAMGAFHSNDGNADINQPLPTTDIVELENEVNEIKALQALESERASVTKGEAKKSSSEAEKTTSEAVSIEETTEPVKQKKETQGV